MSSVRFWLSALLAVLTLTFLFALMITVAGSGTIADLPYVWGGVFGFFLSFGMVIEVGARASKVVFRRTE